MNVFVTGGAGYVGAVLVPKLLAEGHRVKVLDLFLYGDDVLAPHANLEKIKGDLRDASILKKALKGCEAVIHLACVSNDPSFELDPRLGKSINYDAFPALVDLSKDAGVKRFVYASSSSVYGVKQEAEVTEALSLEPLTDYSKFKALCEDILLQKRAPGFSALVLRPATVCGYSPRLRLDLAVNLLTKDAYFSRKLKVFGGSQQRPNIHIEDMTDLYVQTLKWPADKLDGKVYNAGYHNHTLREIADIVRGVIGDDVQIETCPTDDNRSYRISSEKLRRELGFAPKHSIEQAVADLKAAFAAGKVPNALGDDRYYNVRVMKKQPLETPGGRA